MVLNRLLGRNKPANAGQADKTNPNGPGAAEAPDINELLKSLQSANPGADSNNPNHDPNATALAKPEEKTKPTEPEVEARHAPTRKSSLSKFKPTNPDTVAEDIKAHDKLNPNGIATRAKKDEVGVKKEGVKDETKAFLCSDGTHYIEALSGPELADKYFRRGFFHGLKRVLSLGLGYNFGIGSKMYNNSHFLDFADPKNASMEHPRLKDLVKQMKNGEVDGTVIFEADPESGKFDAKKPVAILLHRNLHQTIDDLKREKLPKNAPKEVLAEIEKVEYDPELKSMELLEFGIVSEKMKEKVVGGDDLQLRKLVCATAETLNPNKSLVVQTRKKLFAGAQDVKSRTHEYDQIDGWQVLEAVEENGKEGLKSVPGELTVIRNHRAKLPETGIGKAIAWMTMREMGDPQKASQENFMALMQAQQANEKAIKDYNAQLDAANKPVTPAPDAAASSPAAAQYAQAA